jgi:cyanophycinase-like exopeptidase
MTADEMFPPIEPHPRPQAGWRVMGAPHEDGRPRLDMTIVVAGRYQDYTAAVEIIRRNLSRSTAPMAYWIIWEETAQEEER